MFETLLREVSRFVEHITHCLDCYTGICSGLVYDISILHFYIRHQYTMQINSVVMMSGNPCFVFEGEVYLLTRVHLHIFHFLIFEINRVFLLGILFIITNS